MGTCLSCWPSLVIFLSFMRTVLLWYSLVIDLYFSHRNFPLSLRMFLPKGLSRVRDGLLVAEMDLNQCRQVKDKWCFQVCCRQITFTTLFRQLFKLRNWLLNSGICWVLEKLESHLAIASCDSLTSLVLSNLPRTSRTWRTHANHELIVNFLRNES